MEAAKYSFYYLLAKASCSLALY